MNVSFEEVLEKESQFDLWVDLPVPYEKLNGAKVLATICDGFFEEDINASIRAWNWFSMPHYGQVELSHVRKCSDGISLRVWKYRLDQRQVNSLEAVSDGKHDYRIRISLLTPRRRDDLIRQKINSDILNSLKTDLILS